MAEIAIRPLQSEDYEEWRTLWDLYLIFYEEELPEEVTRSVWARLLDASVDPQGFAAIDTDNNRLIGFTHYLFHSTTWSLHPTCYLEDLFVSETVRGGGVGRALIMAVSEAAQAKDCQTLYWKTQTGNSRARRLYDDVARLSDFVIYERSF